MLKHVGFLFRRLLPAMRRSYEDFPSVRFDCAPVHLLQPPLRDIESGVVVEHAIADRPPTMFYGPKPGPRGGLLHPMLETGWK